MCIHTHIYETKQRRKKYEKPRKKYEKPRKRDNYHLPPPFRISVSGFRLRDTINATRKTIELDSPLSI